MRPTNCLLIGNGVAIVVQTHSDERLSLEGEVSITASIVDMILMVDVKGLKVPFGLPHIEHMIANGTSVYLYSASEGQYTPDYVGEIRLERDMLLEIKGMIRGKMGAATN